MRLRDHGLSIAFGAAFLATLGAQSFAVLAAFNEEQALHGAAPRGWIAFVTSSDFVVDVVENWQSEYLQFFLFILATVRVVHNAELADHGAAQLSLAEYLMSADFWNRTL